MDVWCAALEQVRTARRGGPERVSDDELPREA